MNQPIVQIAIAIPCQTLFDYYWHQSLPDPEIGHRVEVPFGKQAKIGIVANILPHKKQDKLKTVNDLIDKKPVISIKMLKLLTWASNYYHYPIGEVIHLGISTQLRKTSSPLADLPQWLTLNEKSKAKLSPAGKKLWQLIQNLQGKIHFSNLQHYNIQLRTIQKAIEQGWLINHTKDDQQTTYQPITLNPQQQAVFDKIQSTKEFEVHYLEGCTGSGKTYIYAKIMQSFLQKNNTSLLLVPEISLTENIIQKLQQFCGPRFVCLHSKLSATEKSLAWQQINSGWAQWAVGTRSALFLPWQNLSCIIIDEAHDSSFKQQSGWRYSARDCAIMLAKIWQIPIVLGSATPSLESLHNINQKRYLHHSLTNRYANAQPPKIELVDMRGIKQPIHHNLIKKIQTTVANQQQVLIFINRRGFAPVLFCKSCQWISECRRCDAKMTLHQKPYKMICHHCGLNFTTPTNCPSCKADQLAPIGYGSQRVEEWLEQQVDGNILRIDSDTNKKNNLNKQLASIKAGDYNIIIGTQMLAKGHHWPKLTLVIMLSADNDLYSPDFRAMEKFAQLFTQVAGRAGREKLPGSVYIQTKWPEHQKFKALLSTNYSKFALQLLNERQSAFLPPFTYMAYILISGPDLAKVKQTIQQAKSIVQSAKEYQAATFQIIGPMPAWLSQLANQHRMHITLISSSRAGLHQLLFSTKPKIEKIITYKLRLVIDIDPLQLP